MAVIIRKLSRNEGIRERERERERKKPESEHKK